MMLEKWTRWLFYLLLLMTIVLVAYTFQQTVIDKRFDMVTVPE